MATATVDTIERNVHRTNEWLKDLCHELGIEDRTAAWRLLRAHLQVLRDRLTIDEGARLAAAGTRVLRHHISSGEVDDALAQLPAGVRAALEGSE